MLNAGVPPLLLEHRSVCGRLVKIASSPGQDVLEELRDFFPCFFHDRWGFFPGPSRAVRSQGGMGLMHKPCTAWGVGAASGAGLGSPRFAKYTRNFQGEKKGDLQNSLLREPPDSAVSKARQIQPRRKTPPKERLRQSVARCLENSRESICARATDLLPPLGEGVEEVGDRLEGFFQAGGVFPAFLEAASGRTTRQGAPVHEGETGMDFFFSRQGKQLVHAQRASSCPGREEGR